MKKAIHLLAVLLITSTIATANATTKATENVNTTNISAYGKSFIFVEGNIEFSVFPDGQFDFHMANYSPNVYASVNTPGTSISFNSGYDYGNYIQYDEFGAIIQIEHVPVYYDYYGRVMQVGNVFINYNRYGYISRVGGLYVHYNSYNLFTYCTGYINPFNRFYVYRPWHTYYRAPAYNHCVVYNRPYRQYYKPVRYSYTTPYRNNYRRTSAVASRRGNTSVTRRRDLATRGQSIRNRSNRVTSKPRTRSTATINKQRTKQKRATKPQYVTRSNRSVVRSNNTHRKTNTTSTRKYQVKKTTNRSSKPSRSSRKR